MQMRAFCGEGRDSSPPGRDRPEQEVVERSCYPRRLQKWTIAAPSHSVRQLEPLHRPDCVSGLGDCAQRIEWLLWAESGHSLAKGLFSNRKRHA